MKRWVLSIGLLVALCACGRNAAPREADFIFAVGDEHIFIDPQKISWVSDGRIAHCLFETLLTYSVPDLTLEPAAAEKYEVSEDGKTYTFHIRPDARWSNGDPVTAGDFVYAWRRAMLPDFAADYSQLMFLIDGAEDFFNFRAKQLKTFLEKDAARETTAERLWQEALDRFEQTVGLKATDDHTLVVTLRSPTAYFPQLCAFITFAPVHRASLEPAERLNATSGMLERDEAYWTDPARLTTNGPYVLERRRFKRDLLLKANDHFHARSQMKNTSILERFIGEPQTALLAYQQGDVDWLADIPTASPIAADLVHNKRPDVQVVNMAGVYFYNFNCNATLTDGSNNPLADVRVRTALQMAVDRQTLVTKVTRLNQNTVKTFVPPGAVNGYTPPEEAGIGYDVGRAKQLLAEAGFPDGRGLTGLSILYNSGFGHETIAQAIQAMWERDLGVKVQLEGVEVKRFSERLKKHDFTLCRASWFGDYPDPTTWLDKMATGNGNNDCQYTNPEYDKLLGQAANELDPIKRMDLLKQAEAVMLRDSPMLMLYQYSQVYLSDPGKVTGLNHNPWARWRLEQVQVNR
ncbi:MAG: hypothetical protein GC164_03275 [Phycisphaera sp.]|nr:hypothetical protein [Phycisphaera sp.]